VGAGRAGDIAVGGGHAREVVGGRHAGEPVKDGSVAGMAPSHNMAPSYRMAADRTPAFDHGAMCEIEQIEAVGSRLAIEAFDERILAWRRIRRLNSAS